MARESRSFSRGLPLPAVVEGMAPSLWSGLTFWSKFDDVDNPLVLRRGTGALSFTRTTEATFLNPDTGLVTKAAGSRTNIFPYSEDCSQWATLNATLAGSAIAPDGSLTAGIWTNDVIGSQGWFYKTISMGANANTYTMSIFAKAGTAQSLVFWYANNDGAWHSHYATFVWADHSWTNFSGSFVGYGHEELNDGWVRLWVIVANTTGTTGIQATFGVLGAAAGQDVLAWGAQLEVGSFPSLYIPVTYSTASRDGDLRIEAEGALLEGQRTNSLLYSEDPTNSPWVNWVPSGTVATSTTGIDDPAGGMSAVRITTNALDNEFYQAVWSATVQTFTMSFWARRHSGTDLVRLYLGSSTWQTLSLTSEWQRFSATQVSGAGADVYFDCHIHMTGDSIDVWGMQLEVGAFPSSYIPTTTSAVTRNADVMTFPTSSNVSGIIGTVACSANRAPSPIDAYFLNLDAPNYSLPFYYYRSAEALYLYYEGANRQGPSWALSDASVKKIAASWGGSAGSIALDGTIMTIIFGGNMYIGATAKIGSNPTDEANLWGHIKDLRIWSRALSAAEIQLITTWSLDDWIALDAPFDDPADPLVLNKGIGVLSFTRATIATYLHPVTGLITQAASGQLRIEADGALIEGARTNLLVYSGDLSNATGWTHVYTAATSNAVMSPGGAVEAARVNETADTNVHVFRNNAAAVSPSSAYTGSVYLKAGTQRYATLLLWGSVSQQREIFSVDLQTGVISTAGVVHANVGIKDAGNGWYRVWATGTTGASDTGLSWYVYLSNSGANAPSYAGDVDKYIYTWGAQVELGSFPSSYIPTTTAAVTRDADILDAPSIGNLPQDNFTVSYDVIRINNIGGSSSNFADITIGDYGVSPILIMGYPALGYDGYDYAVGNFTSMWDFIGHYTHALPAIQHKMAWAFLSDKKNLAHARNGLIYANMGSPNTSVAKTLPWSSGLHVGYVHGNGMESNQAIYIKNLRIWNRVLNDFELQLITTP